MQGITYSVFSVLAVAIHLAFNSKMLLGRGVTPKYKLYYRDFLFAVLTYYAADGAWGVFAELGWQRAKELFGCEHVNLLHLSSCGAVS